MHHAELYPFVEYHYADGEIRYRTELPVRVVTPHAETSVDALALIDTGADACLFDRSTAEQVGHDLAGDGVLGSVTGGVDGQAETYRHTIQLALLNGSADQVVWRSEARLYDCIDADIPILLGVEGFLSAFELSINYPDKTIRLEWND